MNEPRTNDLTSKEMNELLLSNSDVKLRDRILLSPYTKFLLPSLLIAFVAPVTVYALMITPLANDPSYSPPTCNLRDEYRVDCLPGRVEADEISCTERLCCWDGDANFCYHTVPARHGYAPYSGIYREGAALSPREIESPLGSRNVEEIRFNVTSIDVNHVEIKLTPGDSASTYGKIGKRNSETKNEDRRGEDELTERLLNFLPRDRRRRTVEIELDAASNLRAYVHYPEFSVTVERGGSGDSVLSTARGPLILTETYWEWSLYLSDGSVYGLNDLELNGTTNWIYNNENGTITPSLLSISRDGRGAAYYVDYKGPLEVQVLNVSNLVILRGIGLPENLSIHVFAGPTPIEAVRQLALGLPRDSRSPFVFPHRQNYGLHVCPNGAFNGVEESVNELNATIASLASLDVVWDSHCIHENLASVLNADLTADDLEFIEIGKSYLDEGGRSFSPHLSPMILGDEGSLPTELDDASLLLSNGSISYVGVYQGRNVVYPDWGNPRVKTIAANYLNDYLNSLGSPESLWVRDAWPKDETNSTSESRPDFSPFDYMPEKLAALMTNSTVPYDLSTSYDVSHYLAHNSYAEKFRGLFDSSPIRTEFGGPPGERGNTSWSGLRRSIRSAVGSCLAGQLPPPIYVCGTGDFDVSVHDELCMRWYQASVTWPHVISLPDRLPSAISAASKLSASASLTALKALRLRASLATYQNTLVANFLRHGSPLLAPTRVHFPDDERLANTPDQFMWGEAILVGLVSLPRVAQVAMRIPGNDSWSHLMGGAKVIPSTNGKTPVTATSGEMITLVRPGYVVPVHKVVGATTMDTISSNLTLSVNLNCDDGEDEADRENCSAVGEIYYGFDESGDFLKIKVNRTHLTFENVLNSVGNNSCNRIAIEQRQSTFVDTVQLLANSSYKVDTELCDIMIDSFAVNFA